MKIIGVHCPYCGGNIKFDVDVGSKHCFCIHCGQQIILDDEVIRTEHTERNVDEARIHEADVNERIKLKELELKEKEMDSERKKMKIYLVLGIVWCIFFFIFIIVGLVKYGGEHAALFGGLWAIIGSMFLLFWEGNRKK